MIVATWSLQVGVWLKREVSDSEEMISKKIFFIRRGSAMSYPGVEMMNDALLREGNSFSILCGMIRYKQKTNDV
jgi:hypothetical protein